MTDTAPTGADNTINLQFVGGDLQTHVFTLADFGFTDADGDNLSGVVLTTLPFHSTSTLTGLYYNGVSALPGATISAADITDGKLVYYFQSSASADDSFTFQVVDDSGLTNNTDQTARVMDLHPRAHVQFDVSNDFAYGKGDTLHFLAGLSLSDASDTQLSTVTITSTGATSNITFDQSVLASLGINYDDNGNEIVLSANQVDLSSWQSALQTLAFNNPGPFDTRTPDTITFDVQDSLGMSTTANIEIDYQSEISVSATSRTGNIANPSPLTAGKVVNITLDASALITNGQTLSILGTPTLKLSDNGIATYNKTLSNLAFGQIVFSYTVKAGENTSNLTIQDYLFTATNAIKISDGTVLAAGDLPYHPVLNYHTVDTLAPTLHVDDGDDISHTIQPGDKLKIGDTVYIRVEASEDLKVTGTPTLKLSNGATATYVSPTSASGSGLYTGQDQLYFAYTVAAGQDTADLKVSSIAGTLTDVAGNAANLKLTGSTDLQAAVDAKAPTVTKVVVTDADNPGHVVKGTIGADRHLTITITMSEPVKYTQPPDIEINLSGHPVFDAAHSTDTVLVFNYTTSQNMNYESFLQTSSFHYGAPVTDNAGNAVTIPKNIDLGFKVDSRGPQFSATVSAKSGVLGSKLVYTLTPSEKATIALGTTPPTLSLSNGGIATYDPVASKNGVLKFNYTVAATDANSSSVTISKVNMNGMTWTDTLGNVSDDTHLPYSLTVPTGIKIHASTADTWIAPVDGFFYAAENWSGGVPDATKDAIITAKGNFLVTAGTDLQVASLVTASGVGLTIVDGTFTTYGGTGLGASAGTISVGAATLAWGYPATWNGDDTSNNVADAFTNFGTINLSSSAVLAINSTFVLQGGGKLNLNGATIKGLNPAYTVLTNLDNTITGYGTVVSAGDGYLNFTNGVKGTVIASGGTLTLESASNTGKMTTQGTGVLQLFYSPNSGIITAASAGGTVEIRGGYNTGTISATVAGATVDLGYGFTNYEKGIVSATAAGSAINITSSADNYGTMSATAVGSTIAVTNTFLGGNPASKVNIAKGATLDLLDGNVSGTINIAAGGLVNVHSDAQYSDGSSFYNATVTNAGTINVSGMGLSLYNFDGVASTFTNTGTINVTGSTLTFGGGTGTLAPTIINKGNISLAATDTDNAVMKIDNDATLQGGGKLTLSDSSNNLIRSVTGVTTLTNVDNTISGSGLIGSNFVNQAKGTVIGNGLNAGLSLYFSDYVSNAGKLIGQSSKGLSIVAVDLVDNSGSITTQGAGQVTISAGTVIHNTSTGVISAATSGSMVTFYYADITGGTVSAAAGATLDFSSTDIHGSLISIAAKGTLNATHGTTDTLSDVALVNAGTINVVNGYLSVSGTFTNSGTVNIQQGVFNISGGAILNGTVNISGGAVADFSKSSANITFVGDATGGIISESTFFGGTVSNFGGLDYLDLKGIDYDVNNTTFTTLSQNATQTVLHVSDLVHSMNITFKGDYTSGATFALQDDGEGHAELVMQGQTANSALDDIFIATRGTDTFTGSGNSTISYANATSGVDVDLSLHTPQSGGPFSMGDTLVGFENIIGSGYGDTLKGNTDTNMIAGGGGADLVYTAVGHTQDIFVYTALTDSGATAGTRDTIYGFIGHALLEGGLDQFQFSSKLFSTPHFEADGLLHKVKGDIIAAFDNTLNQTIISIDVNGDGKIDSHDMTIALDGHHTLTQADFIVV